MPHQGYGCPRLPSIRMTPHQVTLLQDCLTDLPARNQQSLHKKMEQVQHGPKKETIHGVIPTTLLTSIRASQSRERQ